MHRAHMVPYLLVRGARGAVTLVAGALAAPSLWMLVVLGAAARRDRASGVRLDPPLRAIVVVPAHDEEAGLPATLEAIARLDPPAADVVVVADHCTDRTADLARSAGATVLERVDGARGKGAALGWAFEQLASRMRDVDVVVLVDADCHPTPNLLDAVGRRIRDGAEAVQVDYVVSNADAGPAAALRDAAFRLRNTIRPTGQDALGLSAGLLGTGMAFTPALLERRPWTSTSVVEDAEQHLALVDAGERVVFARDAAVRSGMPATFAESSEQQLRWEAGRGELLRAWGPRLARTGLRERDPVRLGALVELLLPPQSLLLAGQAGALAAAVAIRAPRARKLAAAGLAGQAAFVLGGLALAGTPRSTYRALLHTPALVAQKLGIASRIARGGAPTTFVRTGRG